MKQHKNKKLKKKFCVHRHQRSDEQQQIDYDDYVPKTDDDDDDKKNTIFSFDSTTSVTRV